MKKKEVGFPAQVQQPEPFERRAEDSELGYQVLRRWLVDTDISPLPETFIGKQKDLSESERRELENESYNNQWPRRKMAYIRYVAEASGHLTSIAIQGGARAVVEKTVNRLAEEQSPEVDALARYAAVLSALQATIAKGPTQSTIVAVQQNASGSQAPVLAEAWTKE